MAYGATANTADGRSGLLVYGAAHFGKSLLWNASSLFFAFFLTEIVGLSPQTMGVVLAVSLFVNALTDMGFGRLITGVVQTPRDAGRIQLIGALAAGLAFIAFAATPFIPSQAHFGYTLTTLLVFRIGYSIYDVPQNAYMALATQTDERRAAFAGMRYIAAGASVLVIASLLAPLIRNGDPQTQALGYLVVSGALVLLAAGLAFGLSVWTRRLSPPASKTPIDERRVQRSKGEVRWAGGFTFLLLGIFVLSSVSPLFSKLEAYFAAYALNNDIAALGFMISVAAGKVVAQPFWTRLAERVQLETVLQIAAALLLIAGLYFASVSRSGALGTITSGALYGIAWGGVAMALWSLLARFASEDKTNTTTRYGLFTFCSKTAQGLALLGLGHVLGQVDYTGPQAGDILVAIMATGPIVGGVLLGGLPLLLRGRQPGADNEAIKAE